MYLRHWRLNHTGPTGTIRCPNHETFINEGVYKDRRIILKCMSNIQRNPVKCVLCSTGQGPSVGSCQREKVTFVSTKGGGGGDCLTISFSGTVHHAAHYVRCTGSDLAGCLCAASKFSSAFSCKNWWEQHNTAIGTADAAAKTRNMRPTSRRRGPFEGAKTACTACCIT